MSDNFSSVPLPHNHGNFGKAALLRNRLERSADFSAVAEVFSLLDDASRVKIFWLLCHCEECVVNISALTEMSSPAVSHHLRLLRDAGLIESRRCGKEVYYRASASESAELLHSVIERVMEVSCPRDDGEEIIASAAVGCTSEQIETVRRLHNELMRHPEKRVTIEELAKKYLMNPTTLKDVFKTVYGDSLALHMKNHRMEKAAELLGSSALSIAEIASAVGYDSPSRFSSAFRDKFGILPSEYRKRYR